MPANINDDDIRFDASDQPVEDWDDFTNTTFTLLACKAQYAIRLMNFSEFMEPGIKYMHKRQHLVSDFQQTAQNLLRKSRPHEVDFHWYTTKSAQCVNASLQLIALRPLQRNINFTPPRIKESDCMLKLAVNVLQTTRELDTDPRGRLWRWFDGLLVPWHALAVALAELCVCQDPILMLRYFLPVEDGYHRFTSIVTDSQQRMLWGPMEKFMSRACTRREELIGQPPTSVSDDINIETQCQSQSSFSHTNTNTNTNTHVSTHEPSNQIFPLRPSLPAPPPPAALTTSSQCPSIPTHPDLPPVPSHLSPPSSSSPNTDWLLFNPWPNIWDATDFGFSEIDNLPDTSWANYESLLNDIYGSNYESEIMSMSTSIL